MSHKTNNTVSQKPRVRKKAGRHTGRSNHKTLVSKCQSLLGGRVSSIQYPGGRSRQSFRVLLEDGLSVIASIRGNHFQAKTEGTVLQTLSSQGSLVPRFIASDGRAMLIQEEIHGERLSQALHAQEESRVERLLDAALTSLSSIHLAGSKSGWDQTFPTLGNTHEWMVGLLDRPAIIGRFYNIPAPRPKLSQLETFLSVRKPRFIKWDSRPGNAMVTKDDRVYWFDWEHCGVRNRLDDMVWLLADEYVAGYPAVEERLLANHLPHFADDLPYEKALHYFYAYGVFHLTVRLGLICRYKEDKPWWDYEYCLSRDKVGVTLQSALYTCEKGSRWAIQNPYTEALGPWFTKIATHLRELPTQISEKSL